MDKDGVILRSKHIIAMDIHEQKLALIESLLKIKNEALILKVKVLIEFAVSEEEKGGLSAMSLETFYNKILNSEEAIKHGEIISQQAL